MEKIFKYPRTPHLQGSGLQPDDDRNTVTPYSQLAGRYLVIEEKMDGANCGISFNPSGELKLQSRGHFLTGGQRERQFDLLKSWATRYAHELWELLGERYILYGEWLYAKHTIFYDQLPHYFLAFDLFDKQTGTFLSTARRKEMLKSAPFIASVHILYEGMAPPYKKLLQLVGPSHFVSTDAERRLDEWSQSMGLEPGQVKQETDLSRLMEGLYIKVEENGIVTAQYKWVRPDFIQTIIDSGSHWLERPLIPNQLQEGVTLF